MPLSEDIAAVTERAQLEQAARGSADALAGLFEQHAAMVHRVAYRLTMSADDAEDIAAGTFDCWKVQIGEPEDQSFMWVDSSTHIVIRSQTTHRFGDTSFEDQVDLQRMILIPE
jgi:hypothetical protein